MVNHNNRRPVFLGRLPSPLQAQKKNRARQINSCQARF